MGKQILVTGAAGFIGANFVLYILKNYPGDKVINLDSLTYAGYEKNLEQTSGNPDYTFIRGDIRDYNTVSDILRNSMIDYVVNFAAESHVDRSILDPNIFVSTNVMGTVNLLNSVKSAWQESDNVYRGGVKFTQVSTDEVYGSLGETGYFSESSPLDPHSPYSASKASADMFAKAYASTYKLPVNIVRCSNNYGPFQHPEKLIPLMIAKALRRERMPIYGDGLQVRDWLYVEDNCQAIDMVMRRGKPGEIYNIGGRNEKTNLEVTGIILRYINEHADSLVGEHLIEHVKDRKGHDRRYSVDSSKIMDELGWKPQTGFNEGMENTIQWYLDYPQWLERT